jgi:hypothetical protein
MTKLTSSDAVMSRKRTGPTSPLTKLTKMQVTVLSRAAQRQDGAAILPEGMKHGVAHKLAATLVERDLLREVRAKPGMPVWRKSEEEGSRSLIITKLGRATIGVRGKDETQGIEDLSSNSPNKQAASTTHESKTATARPGSKLAEVIARLTRKEGVSIAELIAATGWLAHTTRATLTGLRKRGYAIERERVGKGEASIYRIVYGQARANPA